MTPGDEAVNEALMLVPHAGFCLDLGNGMRGQTVVGICPRCVLTSLCGRVEQAEKALAEIEEVLERFPSPISPASIPAAERLANRAYRAARAAVSAAPEDA